MFTVHENRDILYLHIMLIVLTCFKSNLNLSKTMLIDDSHYKHNKLIQIYEIGTYIGNRTFFFFLFR